MPFAPLDGFLDTVGGLPVHPLVVHFVVVILPLAALAQVVIVVVPRWRRQWAIPILVALVASTVATFFARGSGDELAGHVGTPNTHVQWANLMTPAAVALTIVAAALVLLQRRGRAASRGLVVGAQVVSAALAVAVVVLTALAGHSGAQAAWGGRLSEAAAPATSTATSATTPGASATPSATTGASTLTMAVVAQHDTSSSCWTAVNGNVYDLTAWINAHPGGPKVIEGLCGTDGTAAFVAQHGSDQAVLSRLSTFKLGSLSG